LLLLLLLLLWLAEYHDCWIAAAAAAAAAVRILERKPNPTAASGSIDRHETGDLTSTTTTIRVVTTSLLQQPQLFHIRNTAIQGHLEVGKIGGNAVTIVVLERGYDAILDA